MVPPHSTVSARRAERPARRLQLELTNTPEDVAHARHEVGRFALGAGLDHLEIGAVELATGEACANVVRHAYGSSSGAMTIDASSDAVGLVVRVADSGAGIRRCISGGAAGLGTSIMIALCDTLEVGSGPGGSGTRVTMTFAL